MSKKLKAPKGTDEANANGKSYRVGNDGTVTVPDEAVAPLLERGGFTEIDPLPPPPVGHALLTHPDPNASCSVGERVGDAILVPIEAVADLVASHGFTVVEHVAPQEHHA